MPVSYQFTEKQKAELEAARKENKNKRVDKRLEVLLLRAAGVKRAEVAKKTDYSLSQITELTSNYHNNGLSAIVDNHYGGNRRNMSVAEEAALLEPFKEAAKAGQIIETSEILRAYEKKLGRSLKKDHGQIYRVLKRHGWRKIMPRSKHPNKASDEEIASSKKLKLG